MFVNTVPDSPGPLQVDPAQPEPRTGYGDPGTKNIATLTTG